MIDTLPLWFAIGVAVFATYRYLVLEFRASARYWAERDATDPVVVTGSGVSANRYPRSCGGVR